MIQDIFPHHFDNAYRPRAPHKGDRLFFYQNGQTLFSRASGLPFLYEEAAALAPLPDEAPTYLFSIDEVGFFWVHTLPDAVAGAAIPLPDSAFRTLQPGWLAFASITASQLYRWYQNSRFCGRCGQPMRPDKTERAMRCPQCGYLLYPIICPAVIVAVTHNDRLLLTKYSPKTRPGSTRNYALIAGFAEIGEPFEDTVRREVLEEVGLRVKNLRFYKSQPWSFSGSLLAGFYCDLDGDDETITLQEDELCEGVWFDRAQLPQGGTPVSLTREMIERFRQGPV